MTEETESLIHKAHERIDALEAKVANLTAKLKLHGIHTETADTETETVAKPAPAATPPAETEPAQTQ